MKANSHYAKAIAKLWSDPKQKAEFHKHPEKWLKDHGVEMPSGRKIEVHENGERVFHFVIPEPPRGELSMKELESIAAADQCGSINQCGEVY